MGHMPEQDDTPSPGVPLMAGPSEAETGREPIIRHDRPSLTSTEASRSRSNEEQYGSRPTRVPQLQVGGWWWWELIAMTLSLISAALLIPVLVRVDGLPVEDWSYAILPNTILSILTNITKTAIMVPIAACLSQMKWDHFHDRANSLDHLQLYDDASRGPWGSFILLVTGRAKVISAWAFAIVTLVALGIDPSTQQTIETRTKRVEMKNVTALVGLAQNYSSKAFPSDSGLSYEDIDKPNLHKLELQTSILNGVAGSPPVVDFHCPEPAEECSWDDFDTLAVCGTFRNLTGDPEAYNKTCVTTQPTSGYGEDNIDCTYEFPDSLSLTMSSRTDSWPGSFQSLFNSTAKSVNDVTVFAVITTDTTRFTTEVYSMSWTWCKKTFHNLTASPSGLRHANETTKNLVLFADTTETGFSGFDSGYLYYMESSLSGPDIRITSEAGKNIPAYIKKLFTSEFLSGPFYKIAVRQGFKPLNIAEYMYVTDLANLTANVADTLTAQLRSSGMDNAIAGAAEGRATYRVTYYHVRWPWILVVATEVVATAVLLGVSIFLTRRQPLLKASSMALLAFGLQGWTDEDVQGVGAPINLDQRSKRMWARFGRDEEGYLKFLRSDGSRK